MLPTFVNPFAFWGFISIFALAGIYLFRNKVKDVKVSSLMLWQNKSRLAEGGRVIDRLQFPLLLFLEILIFALLLFSAASPRIILGKGAIPLVIVLDDSISMTAPANDSPRSKALEFLNKNVFSSSFYRISILKAGISPEFLGRRGMTPAEALQYLSLWKCNSPTSDINLALKTVSENFHGKIKTLVISDQSSQVSLSESINWLHFGEAKDNLAITAANRYSLGKIDRCYVEFSNLSNLSRSLKVMIGNLDTAEILQTIDENIDAKSFRRIRFSIPKSTNLYVQIVEDPILFDNKAFLLADESRKVRYKIKVKSKALQNILERTVSQIDFAEKDEAKPDLVFTQDEFLEMDKGWNFIFHTASQPWLFDFKVAINKTSPLSEGLSFEKAFWAISANASMTGTPILTAGRNSLLTVEGRPEGLQFIHFNYSQEYSDLHNSFSWPVLFWNLFDWKLGLSQGPATRNVKAGMNVKVNLDPGENTIELTKPDGKKEKLEKWGGATEFEPDLSGIYRVATTNASWTVAVNLTDIKESNLLPRDSEKSINHLSKDEFVKESADVRWWFLLPAIFLLFIHQWLISRRQVAHV